MTDYRFIKVTPLTPTIGATISGVDLSQPLSDEVFSEVRQAWFKHLVLFFRDQAISNQQHIAFGESFGALHIHPAAPYLDNNPALMKIHADETSSRNNGEDWHTDVSADEQPPMASILRITRTPLQGGDTLWSNMYAAFDALSPTMQALLMPLEAEHAADYSGFYGEHPPQRQSPSAIHPVIRLHPETKLPALYVNKGFTKRICGLTNIESKEVLSMLFDHIKNPNFQCRFQWQRDSMALWDHRCTQHMAVWDYFPETRSGVRVTIKGERPIAAR